jgi:hypothetical protein
MVKACAAVLLASLLWSAAPIARAGTIASPPPPSSGPPSGAPAWKQIYENGQTVYYVGAADIPQTGRSDIEALLAFKVPQVVDGAQVWSVVSHMTLSCDQKQMITVDNTLHALRMGAGKVVQTQAANDTWHQPEPGSLGELIWSTACGAK